MFAAHLKRDGSEDGGWGNNARPMQCTQESGDVIFVPEGWGHSVLNMAESVGWASEFMFGASEFTVHA